MLTTAHYITITQKCILLLGNSHFASCIIQYHYQKNKVCFYANYMKLIFRKFPARFCNCSEPSRFLCKSVSCACTNERFYIKIYLADTPHQRLALNSYIIFKYFFVTHFLLHHIMKCIKILEETIVSDLAATNCGCNGGCTGSNNGGCNSCSIIIWIILLSCLCGNGNGTGLSNVFGCGNGDDCGCGGGCGNNSCVWLILILLFCGGGCGF